MIVLRVRVARLFKRGDGAASVAEPIADRAERKPGRGELRRQRDGLRQNIGSAGKIVARRLVERPLIAPVGDQIAGRDEKRAGIGH